MVKQNAASVVRNRILASADVESNEEIQICHPGRGWDDYDEFNVGSKFLKPFYDLKVKSLSAINTDVIRVDLDFNEKG
jgi:hypothetical protein